MIRDYDLDDPATFPFSDLFSALRSEEELVR